MFSNTKLHRSICCSYRNLVVEIYVRWDIGHFTIIAGNVSYVTCRCDVRILKKLQMEFIVLADINQPLKTNSRKSFLKRKEHSFLKLMYFWVFMIFIDFDKIKIKKKWYFYRMEIFHGLRVHFRARRGHMEWRSGKHEYYKSWLT